MSAGRERESGKKKKKKRKKKFSFLFRPSPCGGACNIGRQVEAGPSIVQTILEEEEENEKKIEFEKKNYKFELEEDVEDFLSRICTLASD